MGKRGRPGRQAGGGAPSRLKFMRFALANWQKLCPRMQFLVHLVLKMSGGPQPVLKNMFLGEGWGASRLNSLRAP